MKSLNSILLTSALVLGLSITSQAQTVSTGVPNFISYQGRVLDSTGAVVGGNGTPVNRTVTFRVWDHPSNDTLANLIYSEEQTVTIADGEFSVLVGQGITTSTPIGDPETAQGPPNMSIADAFNGDGRYLGVTVSDGNVGTVDNEISPRQQIVSSAFAFSAKYAQQVAGGSIDNVAIADGAVTLSKIGSGAVNSSTVVDNSITGSDILNSTIGSVDIADNSITSADILHSTITNHDIAPNAIYSGHIVDGQVTGADITNNTITHADIMGVPSAPLTRLGVTATHGSTWV